MLIENKLDFYVQWCYNRLMLNKIKKLHIIKGFSRRFVIIVAVFAVLFFNLSATLGYAQSQGGTISGYGSGNGANSNVYNNNQSSVTTSPASNITTGSAVLNGAINVTSNVYINVWFEYGTSTNFGYSTPRNSFGTGYSNYNYSISGLKANTMHYFRAVAQTPSGIQYGNVESFTTNFLSADDNSAISSSPATTTTSISSTPSKEDTEKTSDTKDTATLASLGANAFGAGTFFPTNIFGWLILLIFILLIILLSKQLYLKFSDKKHS